MTQFQDKWVKTSSSSVGETIVNKLKSQPPLKPQLEKGVKRVHAQVSKLDNMLNNLKTRDKQIFQDIIDATQHHDTNKSHVLANELAEVRKVSKILTSARMSLEQIELRLMTAHDLGDTVVTIMPTVGLMKNLQSSMSKFMPGADKEIAEMADTLSGLMFDTFSGDTQFGVNASTTAESESILQEATAVAESQLDNKLPSMPDANASDYQAKYE